MSASTLAGYDFRQSYDWNYQHAPEPVSLNVPVPERSWDFCGLPVESPLGIAAGPLLNGRWILYYASLGFDVLTYKTVRSAARACYPMPNLQPVAAGEVQGGETLAADPAMNGSWAVSFGMPSKPPDVWRADVEATRKALPENKVLSVSVVASPQADWAAEQMAEDYAQCARWAVDSGADCVEANFSCPNVSSADGQLYQNPVLAGLAASRVRQAIGEKPLLVKVGHVRQHAAAGELISALEPYVDALVMVNCIPATVRGPDGTELFSGESRGIAGQAIRNAVLEQIKMFAALIAERQSRLKLVGVGGISTAGDTLKHLRSGCQSVQLATAAMLDPGTGLEIRAAIAEWSL